MMYTMPKNLLSICVNFALATQQIIVRMKPIPAVQLNKLADYFMLFTRACQTAVSKFSSAIKQ